MRRTVSLLIAMLCWCAVTAAGEFNEVLSVGDEAPAWQDLIAVDDQTHSLGHLREKQVVVVVFTCNSCPYAVDVEDRLIALHKKYNNRNVAVVAINVNKVEEDLLPAMKNKAESKGFRFPYLFDPSQQIAKDYGALYTPQFFVLDQARRVVYMGAMDDSPDGKQIQQRFVESAIDAALSGAKPTVQETVPIGCRIRLERTRKSRTITD